MRAPALTLIDLLTGYRVTQALYVAARLAIADRMAEGPQGSEELARATGADAGALRRLLRALVSFGVLAEEADGRFALTEVGALLRDEVPGSLRAGVIFYGDQRHWKAWAKWIIHDWDDEHSLAILRNCHRAMTPGAQLLLVERVVPERIDPSADTQSTLLADLNMLLLTGGHERTSTEYRTLLGGAGFALARIVPTATPLSVIEATRA